MRYRLAAEYGGPVPDDRLGMAINSAYGRSQNQLHIHLTCLREDVRRQLQAERPTYRSNGDLCRINCCATPTMPAA